MKKLALQTLIKIKYNVGSIPSNLKFKYTELIERNKCEEIRR